MSDRKTLALGVDLGTSRTRVALVERDRSGTARLIAVATATTGSDPVAALRAARAELPTRERRCVLALGGADSMVRTIALPVLPGADRVRAARFEAVRFAKLPLNETAIRLIPLDASRCVIAVARRSALAERVRTARSAGLTPVAIDDAGVALTRAFPEASCIVDLGLRANRLIVRNGAVARSREFAGGGAAITAALMGSLGIDEAAAELRKRSTGLAGAGEHARTSAIERLSAALVEHRADGDDELAVTLVGNGARLQGLPEALALAAALPVRIGTLAADVSATLPADVVRSATPDWALAFGLALWAA